MSEFLVLSARITPKAEHFLAAKRAVIGILKQTRAEPGCRAFNLYEAREDAAHLYLHEVWDDSAALAFHHSQPYTRDVFASYVDWLACPVEITELRELNSVV